MQTSQVVIHPSPQSAKYSYPASSSGADNKGSALERPLMGCCSSTALRAFGQAISREFRGLGTSLRARAARIAASRTGAHAFIEAFSVMPRGQSHASRVKSSGFDSMEMPPSQDKIAEEMLLPTSFASVRDSKGESNPKLTRSDLPQVLDLETFRQMSPAVLDKFLAYSLKGKSAENSLFLIALELLQSSAGSLNRRYVAIRMKHAFMKQDAPLAPNFSTKTKAVVQSLLDDLAAGRERLDLGAVAEQATRNLLQSYGADAYARWRQELPQ